MRIQLNAPTFAFLFNGDRDTPQVDTMKVHWPMHVML